MSKQERALRYFRLADQYLETAKLLLETLIQNDNSNVGLGNSEEDAYAQMVKISTKSDLYVALRYPEKNY